MADLFTTLARRALPLGKEPAKDGGLRKWFVRGAYRGNIEPNSPTVVLGNVDPSNLLGYLAFDYEHFSLASYESFSVVALESINCKLVSWSLLKLYYSAFFAAHAIMRCLGAAVVKIDREQIDIINAIVGAAVGSSPNLVPGMYLCKITEIRPGQLEVRLEPHTDGAGVHDGFWKTFAIFLDGEVEKSVTASDSDANTMLAGVDEINKKVRGWLAARRNDINYQQKFGVWYPLKESKLLNGLIQKIDEVESRSISLRGPTDPVVPCFINITQYLACLNIELAGHIAARSGKTGSFQKKLMYFQAMRRSQRT
jgi:hypothetical protein